MELYRDGVDCPWGFRLKGGIDVDGGTPLEIIRVRHIFGESKYCYGVYIPYACHYNPRLVHFLPHS